MSDKITPEQLHELIEAMNGRRDRERNEDKYLEKFGEGFPDSWYKIMADSTKDTVEDYRQHPLTIERKEIVLKFD